MTWLNSTLDWISSPTGSRLITGTILPFVAIVVAGVVAAVIGRAMASRILDVRDRESKAAAVASLVAAARRSVGWSALSEDERSHATLLADEAGIRLRLLPTAGASLAAEWTEHEIASIRDNSATFRFQAEQTFADVRDRLVEWQAKPARAKRLFRDDLARWQAEEPVSAVAPAGELAAAVASAAAERDAAVARATGSTPVVTTAPETAPPVASAPAGVEASSTASTEPGDTTDTAEVERLREPAYSSPVSAGDVRRRTSPDAPVPTS